MGLLHSDLCPACKLTCALLPTRRTPPQVKAKNPAYGIGDIAKEIGAMWKTISDKEKSKFEEMAAKDKERYEKEKAKYTKK